MSIFDRFAKTLLKAKSKPDFPKQMKSVGNVAFSTAAVIAAASALTPNKEQKLRNRLNMLNVSIQNRDGTAQERKQLETEVKFIKAVLAEKEKKDG